MQRIAERDAALRLPGQRNRRTGEPGPKRTGKEGVQTELEKLDLSSNQIQQLFDLFDLQTTEALAAAFEGKSEFYPTLKKKVNCKCVIL